MRFFIAALFVLLFWGSHAARALVIEEAITRARVKVTDHVLFSNAKDPTDNIAPATQLFMHEDFVRAEYGRYQLGIQFTNRVFTGDVQGENKPFNLEKKQLEADWGNWELRLGDSQQEWGRGIALSLYREDAFGINNSLEGASLRYRPRGFEASFVAGRVNSLRAPVAINPLLNPVADRTVWLAGLTSKVRVAPQTQLGAHYLLALNTPTGDSYFSRSWHTSGASFSQQNILEDVDFYMESNVLLGQNLMIKEAPFYPVGYGSYLSTVWTPVPWKVKWEVKDYRFYTFDFRRPPTLEEDIIESLTQTDVSGSRWVLERHFLDTQTVLSSSYLLEEDRSYRSTIHHGVLGAKFPVLTQSQLETRAGYRFASNSPRVAHAQLKSKFPTFPGQAIEFGYRKQLTYAPEPQPMQDKNIFDLTYTFSPKLGTTLGYEFVPTNPASTGQHYVSLSVTGKIGSFSGRTFIGQTSGGTLCSGGICRQVPPYTGALLETTYIF